MLHVTRAVTKELRRTRFVCRVGKAEICDVDLGLKDLGELHNQNLEKCLMHQRLHVTCVLLCLLCLESDTAAVSYTCLMQ